MNLAISIAFAVVGSVVVGIALRKIFQSLKPSDIAEYRPCKGGWWEAEMNRCEEGLLMVPQQPVNTYTNLAYLAGGLFMMFQLNTLPAYIFSLTSLYLCVGSALYHATSTRWAGSLDVSAIYALFSALAVYAASRHLVMGSALTALIMFVIAILSGYLLRYKFQGNMSLKVGIFIVIIYALEIWIMLKNNNMQILGYLIASFALFALAYLVWNLDKARKFPFKRWGHGLWHIFTAAAAAILFYGIYLS